MTKYWTIVTAASVAELVALLAPAFVARADIFQWEYVNPANPSLGKQQSTTLCIDGAGVNAVPGAYLASLNLTKAYLSGVNLGGDIYSENFGVEGADLTGANLSQADLTGVDFSGAYITSPDWVGYPNNYLYYPGASLRDANLTGADVRGANFTWVSISFAQLYSTASYQAHDLSGITFGQSFAGANLAGRTSRARVSPAHYTPTTDMVQVPLKPI
jgi:uncharacterized protein YjbI with pentapeptide repeats